MFPLSSTNFNVLERSLDAASLRQKVIANNLANVDTPYFKRSEVHFEQLLHKELEATDTTLSGYRTDPHHFPIGRNPFQSVQPNVKTDEHTIMNNNMNNVDVDYEMSLMAKNQLRYNALIGQVNHELKLLRTSINGRG